LDGALVLVGGIECFRQETARHAVGKALRQRCGARGRILPWSWRPWLRDKGLTAAAGPSGLYGGRSSEAGSASKLASLLGHSPANPQRYACMAFPALCANNMAISNVTASGAIAAAKSEAGVG
jgi:hypothetical protein